MDQKLYGFGQLFDTWDVFAWAVEKIKNPGNERCGLRGAHHHHHNGKWRCASDIDHCKNEVLPNPDLSGITLSVGADIAFHESTKFYYFSF